MIYLRDFEFHDSYYEHQILSLEHRTCFRDIYPFDVFPAVGLTKLAFEPVTLLYGGNGSGKSTALNIIASKLGLQRYVPFIATHSPFILGIKGARIYDLDTFGVPVRKWTELENVREYFQLFYGRRSEFEMPANEI